MLEIPVPDDNDFDSFEHFPAEAIQRMRERGVIREYATGELILTPGDVGDRLVRGVEHLTRGTQERTFAVIGRGNSVLPGGNSHKRQHFRFIATTELDRSEITAERQSWCRYICGLGGMISVLSKSSAVELRADRNVCVSQCSSNECFLGTAEREGFPFGVVVPKLHSNRFCKLCGICVTNCPHGASNCRSW